MITASATIHTSSRWALAPGAARRRGSTLPARIAVFVAAMLVWAGMAPAQTVNEFSAGISHGAYPFYIASGSEPSTDATGCLPAG